MSDNTARNVRQNLKCPTKQPDMSDEIAHSQQTMNQGNKISSVRPGTINIELGLDLYVLYIYYKGPKTKHSEKHSIRIRFFSTQLGFNCRQN